MCFFLCVSHIKMTSIKRLSNVQEQNGNEMHGFKTKMGMINAPFKTFPNVNANDDEMLRASYTLHSQKTRINWRGRRRWR